MGEILCALERLPAAAEAYRTALSLNPDLPQCANGVGLLLVRDRDFLHASACFEAALRATPAHMLNAKAGLWANLGSARIDAGEVPKGLSDLSEPHEGEEVSP